MPHSPLSPYDAFATLEATWPPAAKTHNAGWTIRDGQAGGKRVSAATRLTVDGELEPAETAMRARHQTPLFMLRADAQQDAMDLAARGYRKVDPTVIRAAAIESLDIAPDAKRHVIECTERLAIMEQIWAAGGIGPSRLAVMDRVTAPHIFLLARDGDIPAGVAFVALHNHTAMLHALEVLDAHRSRGLGTKLTRAAAHWAARAGATHLSLAVTQANAPANALYERLGLPVITRYEYWQLPD